MFGGRFVLEARSGASVHKHQLVAERRVHSEPAKNAVSLGVGVCVSVERSIVTKSFLAVSVSGVAYPCSVNKQVLRMLCPVYHAPTASPFVVIPGLLICLACCGVRALPASSCPHLASVAYNSDNNNRFRPCLQCRARFPCVNDQPLHLSTIRYGKARWQAPLPPGVQQPSMKTRTAGACG